MNPEQLIKLLFDTGHLKFPFGNEQSIPENITKLTYSDKEVKNALRSYQTMFAGNLSPLISKHHPNRFAAVVIPDGEVGPALLELAKQPRCACPDYKPKEEQQEALGRGSWKSCHNIGNFHSAKVKILNSPPPFLEPHFESIWRRVVDSYAELGLLFVRDDQASNPNIDFSFVVPDSGWIGLAIVGRNQSCSSKIWCRYDRNYRPSNLVSEWTTLIKHELGHNCGLDHSNGGVMNPYLLAGLPVSWKGDPSYNILVSMFGGQPIPREPETKKLVVAYQYGNNTFDVLYELPSTNTGIWPV